jgi:hypothetical protein
VQRRGQFRLEALGRGQAVAGGEGVAEDEKLQRCGGASRICGEPEADGQRRQELAAS